MKSRKIMISLLVIAGLANFTILLISVASKLKVVTRNKYYILSPVESYVMNFTPVIRAGGVKRSCKVSTHIEHCTLLTTSISAAEHNGSKIEARPNKKQVNDTGESGTSVNVVDKFRSINSNWTFNTEQANKLRSDLDEYCKTSERFVLTQKIVNLDVNGTLKYDGPTKWQINVTVDVYNRLPKEIPYQKEMFKKCSVVGNSGILLNSKCGKFIDAADFIVRINMARVYNYSEDVGSKTDLVTCNPSMFTLNYSKFNEPGSEKYKNDIIVQFENATVYTTGYSFRRLRKSTFRAQNIHKSVNSDVIFAHSHHISSVKGFYREKYSVKESSVSTGLLMFTTALSFCEEVHLYGFWPFSEDQEGKPLYYHYYEKYSYMKQVHNMTAEFQLLMNLHNKGAIRLHVGKCDN